jgi:hypothetical protein
MNKPTLTVTTDYVDDFNDIVKRFKHDDVLIGIPQDETEREDEDNSQINNAAILAINEFGSPANNIPARPVMSMGIRDAQDDIADQFKAAFKGALKSGASALYTYYNRAGIIAANSIKKVINGQGGELDGPIEAPAASTIAARQSAGFSGTKALIVTGQMRNAITHVVRGDK